MKITLIKDPKTGYVIGWAMTVENEEDKKTIDVIRNINFLGSPHYNGRISEKDSDDTKTLSWVEERFRNVGEKYDHDNPDPHGIQKFVRRL